MQDWVGIGPSACSQCWNRRFSNPPSIAKWLSAIDGNRMAHENIEPVSEQTFIEDSLIFGLRMNGGVDVSPLKKKFKNVDFSRWDDLFIELERENLAQISQDIVKLTNNGRLVADAIAVEILAA
jgi:oxygen-independent coproporphyrinogen-3 oxidase